MGQVGTAIRWRAGVQLKDYSLLSSSGQNFLLFLKNPNKTSSPWHTHTHLPLTLADRKNCSRESGFREPEGIRGQDKPFCPTPLVSEWVSVCACVCARARGQSCLTLAAPWTVAHQVPLSMGFSRQVLERVVISYFRGSSQPRARTHVSCVPCKGSSFSNLPPHTPNILLNKCIQPEPWWILSNARSWHEQWPKVVI